MSSFDNLEMGPCTVNYKGTDLGLTKGGVELQIATEVTTLTVDQYGPAAIDSIIQGRTVTVKVPMAERNLDNLAKVFPGSTLVTDSQTPTDKKLVIKSASGTSLRSLAGILILHPKAVASGDKSKDVTIPLASAKGDLTYSYTAEDQRVYMAEFTGFVDLTTEELLTFGDPAVA